jgi:hypothetical protein
MAPYLALKVYFRLGVSSSLVGMPDVFWMPDHIPILAEIQTLNLNDWRITHRAGVCEAPGDDAVQLEEAPMCSRLRSLGRRAESDRLGRYGPIRFTSHLTPLRKIRIPASTTRRAVLTTQARTDRRSTPLRSTLALLTKQLSLFSAVGQHGTTGHQASWVPVEMYELIHCGGLRAGGGAGSAREHGFAARRGLRLQRVLQAHSITSTQGILD